MYSDINQPTVIPGLKVWKNDNGFSVAMLHYSADPAKDPNREGKEWYNNEKNAFSEAKWRKEYEIDFTTKSGKLIFGPDFCDFNQGIHFISSFELPEPYELLLGLDFGQRNPTAALVAVWTLDKKLYIIDEYYKPAIPSVSSKDLFNSFAYLLGDLEGKTMREKRNMTINTFSIRVIDPSTGSKNRTKIREGEEIPYSVLEEFYDNGWDFELGKNDVEASITRIREYFQVDSEGKSNLYIFRDKCPNLCAELLNYRYSELTEIQLKTRNVSEEPIKKNDHAVDALRYIIMTRPPDPRKAEKQKTKIQLDIESLLRPKSQLMNNWDLE